MMPGTGPLRGPDGHPLADEHLRIPAADGLGVDEPFGVDVLDQHADLVAVAGQHQPRLAAGILHGDDVAVQVGADLVGKFFQIRPHVLLHRPLEARGAGRCEDLSAAVACLCRPWQWFLLWQRGTVGTVQFA